MSNSKVAVAALAGLLWAVPAGADMLLMGAGKPGAVATATPQLTALSMVGHVNDFTGLPNYSGFGQSAQGRGLSTPEAVCVDGTNHFVAIADSGNLRVVIYPLNSDNTITGTIPSYELGQPDFFTQNVSGPTQTLLNFPSGVACDGAHNRLFVADSTANRILVFSTSSLSNFKAAANVIGQANFTASGTATTQAGVNAPQGIVYDSVHNRLFVADSGNNRVLVYDVSTVTDGMNASFVLGQANFTSNAAVITQAGLGSSAGVAYDGTHDLLFVSDPANSRVLQYNVASGTLANGENASFVLGASNFTTTLGPARSQTAMSAPQGLAYDGTDQWLLVIDQGNRRSVLFDVTPGTISNGANAVHVLGQADFASGGQRITQSSVWVPAFGNYYGAAFESSQGLFYVPDFASRIQIFARAALADNENASWNLGHTDGSGAPQYTAFDKQNWPGPQTAFNTNGAILDTKNHRLFVVDYNDAPNTFTPLGQTGARLLVWNLDSNNNISGLNAVHVIGWPDFFAGVSAGASISKFSKHLSGGCYDTANDRLFIADTGNNRVIVINAATVTDGMTFSHVLGQSTFTGTSGVTTQVGMKSPKGCAYDSVGLRLFVADSGNNRVTVYNADPAAIADGENALHVLGQADFTHALTATSQAGMNSPQENLAYDSTLGWLFVPDVQNNRVLVFTTASSGSLVDGANATYVLGQADFVSSARATTATGLSLNNGNSFGGGNGGVALDPTWHRLFVGDTGNYRTMIFDVTSGAIANGEAAMNELQQASFTTAPSSGSFVGQNGAGESGSGAFDLGTNSYFDTQWAPDRIMQLPMVKITTATLPNGTHNVAYSQTVAITRAQGSYQKFKVFSGALPTGLTLNTATGVISGTPTTPGAYTFVIEADDYFATGPLFDRISYTVTIS